MSSPLFYHNFGNICKGEITLYMYEYIQVVLAYFNHLAYVHTCVYTYMFTNIFKRSLVAEGPLNRGLVNVAYLNSDQVNPMTSHLRARRPTHYALY